MKKQLLFCFAMFLAALGPAFDDSAGAMAQPKSTIFQKVYAVSDANATVWDTVANGATKTQTLQLNPVYKKVSVQINALKIDGTPAGSCKVQRSTDGVYFHDIDSTYMKKKNLLTLANVTTVQGSIWELDDYIGTHIRTTCTGSGTQRTRYQTVVLYNKDNQ